MKTSGWSKKDMLMVGAVTALFLTAVIWMAGYRASTRDLVAAYPGVVAVLIVAALLFAAVTSVIWWRNIDEAAREAHKWSWYWGGSVGLGGVLVLFLLSLMSGGAFGRDWIIANGLGGYELALGMAAGVVLPVGGYVAAWGIWWMKHR